MKSACPKSPKSLLILPPQYGLETFVLQIYILGQNQSRALCLTAGQSKLFLHIDVRLVAEK